MSCSRVSHLISRIQIKPTLLPNFVAQARNGSYEASKFLVDVEPVNTKFEITKNAEEWAYVERLLPITLVPNPVKKDVYPSGWKPQTEDVAGRPYVVARTKNHMIPVYLDIKKRGVARHTEIKNIYGDIWQFEKDLRPFIADLVKPRLVRLQVNEFARKIVINGDHVNAIKHWLTQRDL